MHTRISAGGQLPDTLVMTKHNPTSALYYPPNQVLVLHHMCRVGQKVGQSWPESRVDALYYPPNQVLVLHRMYRIGQNHTDIRTHSVYLIICHIGLARTV